MTHRYTTPSFTLTGCVLAGGLGARLGGADKGWIEVAGQSLIERVLQQLQPQVDRVIINANRRVVDYAHFGWPVVGDTLPDFAGPLAGISAGLEAAVTNWVLFVPVDAARLPDDLAARLCVAVKKNDSPCAFVTAADGPIPVCCLVSRSLSDDLKAGLASGERSVLAWLRRQSAAPVAFDDWPREYWSLNTPQEKVAVERLLASAAPG
jgi:molybdopterin-guanine dinucleotide biosynthesis protein A